MTFVRSDGGWFIPPKGLAEPRFEPIRILIQNQTRRLSQIRLIYYGCAGLGQILRSYSFNRPRYSPQTIEKSDSNRHTLVTITNLGQPPR